jgi:hypothetical protein
MLLLGLGLVVLLAVVFWRPIASYAVTGSAYGARVACSCRFVGGRSLADCEKDLESGMELVTLSEDAGAKSVTARFALLSPQTATFREGEGCVLEKWSD